MVTNFEPPTSDSTTPLNDVVSLDDHSNSSTPFVSAPSSPTDHTTATFLSPPPPSGFFFYSAPTSPVHFILSSTATATARAAVSPPSYDASSSGSFEFEFSSRFDSPAASEIVAVMSSADELFLNGQIRPMKLCAHLSRPQYHDIIEGDDEEDVDNGVVSERSRDLKLRNRSQRRRTRSMSPLRNTTPFDWFLTSDDVVATPEKSEERETNAVKCDYPTPVSGGSSRCSSAGRSSKRWVFLKDFLRSKSEGRSNNKFWQNINISFSAAAKEKEKKPSGGATAATAKKRRSAHEMYAANRAQAEEMKKKTFLPYRQGLLGCLGFNSKSYGALHGFARALNPVSSRFVEIVIYTSTTTVTPVLLKVPVNSGVRGMIYPCVNTTKRLFPDDPK